MSDESLGPTGPVQRGRPPSHRGDVAKKLAGVDGGAGAAFRMCLDIPEDELRRIVSLVMTAQSSLRLIRGQLLVENGQEIVVLEPEEGLRLLCRRYVSRIQDVAQALCIDLDGERAQERVPVSSVTQRGELSRVTLDAFLEVLQLVVWGRHGGGPR